MVSRVFLFDIDLTMIRTNGAGSAAMELTVREMLGVRDAFAGMRFAGRTDRAILREALARCGRLDDGFDRFCTEFEARYLDHLRRELRARHGVVLPGVPELLDAVAALPGARLGLATGNFRRAAEVKLRHFGLWERFLDGGFAEDGEERADLVAAAVARVGAGAPHPTTVYVIGDSIHDVQAAKAHGLVAVGVCTGECSAAELRAAGADVVFADLAATDAVLNRLLQLTAGRLSPASQAGGGPPS